MARVQPGERENVVGAEPLPAGDRGESVQMIQGAGETADLVRSFAWEQTSLGAIAEWSESLVTAVNLMLLSPFAAAIYWGADYVMLYNDQYRELLGAKHPQSLGSRGEQVWPEAWGVIGEELRKTFHEGRSISVRAAMIPILTEGVLQDRWWTYGMNPIFERGRIGGVANPVVEDTAAVRTEQALRRTQQTFEAGMEAASLGMWHYDPRTGIMAAEERMQRMFGSREREGTIDYWVDLMHPEDRERVRQHFTEVLAGERAYDIEYRILRGEEIRWMRCRGRTVGTENDPQRLFAVIEDITERKLTEVALQQSEKLAAVGRLAASIAHEINNPLESVTNLLYLMQQSDDTEEIHAYVETAERELRRVSLIANQTLRFHRQKTKAAPEFCYDLIGDSLAIYEGRIRNNKIQVEKLKRAKHPAGCLGGEIRQVLNNLIGNAIDAMPEGGRLLLRSREALNPRTGERELVITVADSGTGMPASVQARVFEAFYTTKSINGTGLGLWISSEIVARHKGTLRFRSGTKPGRSGTVFVLSLPM